MYQLYRPRIRSRHPSHGVLRPKNKTLPLLPVKSVIRLGSSKEFNDTVDNGGTRIEVNTVQAIANSSDKLAMKNKFSADNVATALWSAGVNIDTIVADMKAKMDEGKEPFPLVSKHRFGSRGTGNKIHNTVEELKAWAEGKDLTKYIFEKYYNYVREYRLHVTEEGCFYTCRKMLKRDVPEDARWFRNDQNCVWIMEENPAFDKPVNWDAIVADSVKALKAVGLDFGAVDLRVQSASNKDGDRRENPKFIVVEINSAPSFGDVTAEKYIEELPKIIKRKANIQN